MVFFLYGSFLRERALEVLSTDLVEAATLFRKAAGVFQHMAQDVLLLLQDLPSSERIPEVSSGMASIMSLICLAEAQAVIVRKAEEKATSGSLLAKLHYGVVQLLQEANSILQTHSNEWNDVSEKLKRFINTCMILHEARSQVYVANEFKKQEKLGVAVGILRYATNKFQGKSPDIAALCTGLRAAVMIDYAMGVSQLQTQLCRLLNLLAQEVPLISYLKVMCMDDMVYLIHVNNLTLFMKETLNHSIKLDFIVLDDTVVRFALPLEKEEALNQFAAFMTRFLTQVSKASNSTSGHPPSFACGLVDLGSSELCCEAPLPTLNGWILGYPVIYYFKKENASKAVRTLSVSALLQFKIMIQSSISFQTSEVQGEKGSPVTHVLTSFTMPSELSSEGVGEEWASSMQAKVQNSELWSSLELQVISQVWASVVL